jgi:streptomycin 6-kinase
VIPSLEGGNFDAYAAAVHPGLAWAQETEAGRAWLERLPVLLEECLAQWSLEVEAPFPYAYASLALPARTATGDDAVLKICFPHREAEHEGDALGHWDGNGAVRLLAQDRERWALLLERCRPGTNLREVGLEAALDVLVGLLPRLWLPAAAPFRPLAEEAVEWMESIPRQWEGSGRPFERELVDTALAVLAELTPTQGEQVLLHQDLHADNVLRAEREPWLVIDPKPLAGEREFAAAPLVRSFELGHSARDVRRRLDRLTAELDLDRERALGWVFAQTVAWSFDPEPLPRHLETARWLRAMMS